MPRIPVVVLLGLCAWATIVDAQANKPATVSRYAVPRTPWGDPDLQGIYTNKYELNTPFERPKEFEGRRMEDVTAAELSEIVRQRQAEAAYRPDGPQAFMPFRDVFELARGSRPWLVVDPPDGQIPPLRPDAEDRATPRRRQHFRRQRTLAGHVEALRAGRSTARRISASTIGASREGCRARWCRTCRETLPDRSGAGIRRDSLRVDPRDPHHSARSAPHVGAAIRLDMGDARGHWERDTLVVETRNFKERSTYRNARAATLRLVERFTRTAPDRIEWAVTVDDPATWTRPWTFTVPLTANNQERILEFACHEGNYALPHMLEAARAAEHAEPE